LYQSDFKTKLGLLSNIPSYLSFYLKLALFLVECAKLNYSYGFEEVMGNLKREHGEKPELLRSFRPHHSIVYKFVKPIAMFMFCSLAVVFALLHPCILFFFQLPLYLLGFFMAPNQFKRIAQFMLLIVGLFVISLQVFVNMQAFDIRADIFKANKEDFKFFGLFMSKGDQKTLFPGHLDFFFYISMAFFVKYLSKDHIQESLEQQQRLSMLSKDEDVLTIPEDQSDIRSVRTGFAAAPRDSVPGD